MERGSPSARTSIDSAMTRASISPPPMEPDVDPSPYTSIFEPAWRGTDRLVPITVASTTGRASRTASFNSETMR